MKTLIFTLLVSARVIWAQPNFNQIAQALKQANITTLAAYWDEQVELTISENDGFYPPAQASEQLSQFFKQNRPTECQVVHNGTARDKSSHYFISSLTAGGKKFRVYVLFKQKNEKYFIQEMRIEAD